MLDWLFRLFEPKTKMEQAGNILSVLSCKFLGNSILRSWQKYSGTKMSGSILVLLGN